MKNYDDYDSTVLTGNSTQQAAKLSEAGLPATTGNLTEDTKGNSISIKMSGNYVAIAAKNAPLMLALSAIEAKHEVLSSHIISIIGGEIHFYPVPYDTLIKPYQSDYCGLFSAAFSIYADDEPVQIPVTEAPYSSVLRTLSDQSSWNVSQEFFDDVWAFNIGNLNIDIETYVSSMEASCFR